MNSIDLFLENEYKRIISLLTESTFSSYPPNFADKMRRLKQAAIDFNKNERARIERRGDKFIPKQVPDFFQPHVELAYMLGHPFLKDINNLKYKDSYYFNISVISNNRKFEGVLRLSNHKANLSNISKMSMDKPIIDVLSIVLMDKDISKPENKIRNKVFVDELHFNQCSDDDLKYIKEAVMPFVNGGTSYVMGTGILNIRPKRRSNRDAHNYNIDQRIEDLRRQISAYTSSSNIQQQLQKDNNINTNLPNNDNITAAKQDTVDNNIVTSQQQPQVKPEEDVYISPKATSEIYAQNAEQQQQIDLEKQNAEHEEEKKRRKEEKHNNTILSNIQHTVEIDTNTGGRVLKLAVDGRVVNDTRRFKDGKEIKTEIEKITIPIKVYNKTFYLPKNDQGKIDLGTYHFFFNGIPYETLKIKMLTNGKYVYKILDKRPTFSNITESVYNEILRLLTSTSL